MKVNENQNPAVESTETLRAAPETGDGVEGLVGRELIRDYMTDLDPDDVGFVPFSITFDASPDSDQPWAIDCEIESDTHQTLDELLFWNLIIGRRYISESLRRKINSEWEQIQATESVASTALNNGAAKK